MSCEHCMRKSCVEVYYTGSAIQTLDPEVLREKKDKFVFDPEKCHYSFCKWVFKKGEKRTGVEITLEMMKARYESAKKAVFANKMLAGVYKDPQKYIEERVKISNQIKKLYKESGLLRNVEEFKDDPLSIKKDTKRLKDVDQLENEKFRQYIENRLKETVEKSKIINEKAQDIARIVAKVRKRVEDEEYAAKRIKKDVEPGENVVIEIKANP